MLQITPKHKIFIAVQPIDFRKGIPSLVALCRQHWPLNPFSGHVFLFRNRKANALKLLCYDSQGFWLSQKKLSLGRFSHWPTSSHTLLTLSPAQLHVLLYNGDPAVVSTPQPWHSIHED